jgi:hypothetical protein
VAGYRACDPCGSCGDTPCGTVSGRVTGCGGLNLAGATVAADDGHGHTYSTTTASDGTYSLGGGAMPAGAYTVTASKSRFSSSSTSVTVTCPGGTLTGVNFALTADAGYVCCSSCPDPYPTTLHATTSRGTVAGTYSTINHRWEFSVSFTTTSTCNPTFGAGETWSAGLYLACPGSVGAAWQVSGDVLVTDLSGQLYYSSGCGVLGGTTGTMGWGPADASGGCAVPLAVSGSAPATWSTGFAATLPSDMPYTGTVAFAE